MKDTKILFLLVNYYNEREVNSFISHQRINYTDVSLQIIIVDNGSDKSETLLGLTSNNPNITVLTSDVNAGYFGGAYIGLNHYLKTNDYPDAVIICNTDISFVTPNFIVKLTQKIAQGNFDILGPDIYSTMLEYHQNPYIMQRISAKRIKLYKMVTSNAFIYVLFTLLHLLKTKFVKKKQTGKIKERIQTYCIHGSFMVFNKTYFAKGGTINYPSLLFGEELFVAETARKLGLTTIYEPDLVINHHEHSTTGVFKSSKTVKFMHQSYKYLFETFFSNE
jgi:GT2 family glycosyltransferase